MSNNVADIVWALVIFSFGKIAIGFVLVVILVVTVILILVIVWFVCLGVRFVLVLPTVIKDEFNKWWY